MVVKIVNESNEIYEFKKFPFGERGTYIESKLTNEIANNMWKKINLKYRNFEYIVSPEPGGHTWGILLSYLLNVPINIIRITLEEDLQFGKPILRKTAYNRNYMYFEHFQAGDKVIIVDDIISSGFTMISIIKYLLEIGVQVVGVQVILVKGEAYKEIEKKYNVSVSYLVKEA